MAIVADVMTAVAIVHAVIMLTVVVVVAIVLERTVGMLVISRITTTKLE